MRNGMEERNEGIEKGKRRNNLFVFCCLVVIPPR